MLHAACPVGAGEDRRSTLVARADHDGRVSDRPPKRRVNIGYRGIWPTGHDVWVDPESTPKSRLGNLIWALIMLAVVGLAVLIVVLLLTR